MEGSASSLGTIVGHAEHVCSVAEGATPTPGIEAVSSSWQRSAKKYGLDPIDSRAPRILTPAELLDKLIYNAQEEIDQLYEVAHEELDQPTSSRRPTPESDRWCSSR